MDHQRYAVTPAQPRTPSIDTLLETLRTGTAPPGWKTAREAATEDHTRLAELISAGAEGYGVTTRVGHHDDEQITQMASDEFHIGQDAFQRDLLDSHRLPARLCAIWTERVVAWLCGGRGGLPQDLRDGDGLGLIQVPKLVTAQVARLRTEVSGRVFASGSATSHGVEDLWSHGLHANAQLDEAISTSHELLALAAASTARTVALGAPAVDGLWSWTAVPGRSFREDVATFRELFDRRADAEQPPVA